MKIRIREIPPQGLDIHEQLKLDALDLTEKEFSGLSPVKVDGKVEKVGNTVLANIKLNSAVTVECGRCLEPVKQEIARDCDFDYEIDSRTEEIDLGEDIRQELVMSFPAAVVCREDCKGLCPGCGANLNTEICKCKMKKEK